MKCVDCAKPAENGHRRCANDAAAHRSRERARYRRRTPFRNDMSAWVVARGAGL